MELIPYLPKHALKIYANAVEHVRGTSAKMAAELYHKKGPAYTLIHENKIIGCGGLMILAPGIAHAWAIFDKDLVKTVSATWIYRTAVKTIQSLREEHNLRRVQTDCNVSNPVFSNFILNIGFLPEGVMKKYGPGGEDHILFSIVEE